MLEPKSNHLDIKMEAFFDFNGKKIKYSESGEGPAIVFLHGFLENRTMWNNFLNQFPHNRCITIDLPGMGESDMVGKVHSMELMAQVIKNLLDHLNIEQTSIVGHSMGGYISLAFAELFPNRVFKIIMLNSTFKADDEERKETRNRAIAMMDDHPRAFISMAISNWATEESRENFKEAIEVLKTAAYNFPIDGIKAALMGMRDREERCRILKDFPGKKYLLLGKEDPLIPAASTAEEAEKLGVKTKIVSGGHLSPIENFPEVLEFLLETI